MPTLSSEQLVRAITAMLTAVDTPPESAKIVAELLVEANLAGHDSHGVIRIPQYLETIERGELVPDAEVELVRESKITAVVEGHRGFGQVTMTRAVDVVLDKAGEHGLAAVTVGKANHIGRLGNYVDRIARHDMLALLFVNAVGIPAFRMAPWGGTEPRLATDPMAIGVPVPAGDPIVIDMTTTVVAEGKVRVKRNRGEPTPDGWLLDADGQPTNDPNVLYGDPRGSILPLGGSAAGHKGYGLNVALELLAGALSGNGTIGVDSPLCNGVLLIALDIAQFTAVEEYHRETERFLAHVKSSPPIQGVEEILMPGEIEQKVRQQRLHDGVFIEDGTWQQILDWADKLGVNLAEMSEDQ
ncbi:MAG: Ldh family oxidoreductase [Candidatus Latescibacterota bacterium]|nr:Ldh family oxidoreductase [Candidatus Latescibacterota bacterium]